MSHKEPWAPLHDIPAPSDVADVVDLLMVALIWLDANDYRYAAIDVNDAVEKLTPKNSG